MAAMKGDGRVAKVLWVVLPLAVLLVAGGITVALVMTKPQPNKGAPQARGPLVEIATLEKKPVRITVEGHGTVRAAREVTIQAQISGRLAWVSPDLVPGAVVREGQPLFRIEEKDHRLGLEQSLAQLARARSELAGELGRHVVAEVEWEKYQADFGVPDALPDPPLATREPQLAAAKVALRSARAQVALNQVALSRTEVEAPFDAFVDSEQAEKGQLVTPQTSVAQLVGIDRFWVYAQIPVDQLPYVDVPKLNAEEGSSVIVRLEAGGFEVVRAARVVQLLGRLDEGSRMARLLIQIDDPLKLGEQGQRGFPLLVDAYVDVSIEGNEERPLVVVPREALHEGDQVHLFRDGKLLVKTVSVAWRRDEVVLVDEGLEGGEKVVMTRLSQPVDGMPLRKAQRSFRIGER